MPAPLMDGVLLEFFGYRKTLEEIDKEVDKARLARALQALGYRDAWERVENRKDPEREKKKIRLAEQRDAQLVKELWMAYKETFKKAGRDR